MVKLSSDACELEFIEHRKRWRRFSDRCSLLFCVGQNEIILRCKFIIFETKIECQIGRDISLEINTPITLDLVKLIYLRRFLAGRCWFRLSITDLFFSQLTDIQLGIEREPQELMKRRSKKLKKDTSNRTNWFNCVHTSAGSLFDAGFNSFRRRLTSYPYGDVGDRNEISQQWTVLYAIQGCHGDSDVGF